MATIGTVLSNVWIFGDGVATSSSGGATTEVEHTYPVAGYYQATNFIYGTQGHTSLVSQLITVLPQTPLPGLSSSIWGVGFIGSIAGPGVAPSGALSGIVYQESKRDVASFDIDRFPLGNFGTTSILEEDTDAEPTSPTYRRFPRITFANNSTNRFRMEVTLGGAVFSEQAARGGPFVLQSGRLQP